MKIKNIIIILIVVALMLTMKFIFFPSQSTETDSAKQPKSGPVNVTAYIVHLEKLSNEVYSSGTILANEEVQLQPELAGKITQINFKEGSLVTKGQLLVKINDADLQAQSKKLQLQYTLADEKMQRQKQLLAINGISQEEFDIAQNQYNTIKADMEYSAAQIAKTEIHAPFNGVIGLKNVSEGAFVSPNAIIATIQQIDPVKIDFSVSERYANMIKKGDKVSFTIEGNEKEHHAEVFAIEPKIDIETRTVMIRALCPNSKADIFPGAFAHVQLALNDIDSAMMVPSESIIPELKGQKVYLIKNGAANPSKVTTALRTDSRIQITSGISDGDTVITTGMMQIKPGASVKVVEFKKDQK